MIVRPASPAHRNGAAASPPASEDRGEKELASVGKPISSFGSRCATPSDAMTMDGHVPRPGVHESRQAAGRATRRIGARRVTLACLYQLLTGNCRSARRV